MYNSFDVGNRLRDLREKNRTERKDLAHEFGISYHTLANYESGKTIPTLDILEMYCSKFDISADDIMYGRCKANNNLFKIIKHLSPAQQDAIYAVIKLFR